MDNENEQQVSRKSKRGFASMSPEKVREIAAHGGRTAHEFGKAHTWNSTTAQAAGRKGGATVAKSREHMSAIGKMGGSAPHRNRANREKPQIKQTAEVVATVESDSV